VIGNDVSCEAVPVDVPPNSKGVAEVGPPPPEDKYVIVIRLNPLGQIG